MSFFFPAIRGAEPVFQNAEQPISVLEEIYDSFKGIVKLARASAGALDRAYVMIVIDSSLNERQKTTLLLVARRKSDQLLQFAANLDRILGDKHTFDLSQAQILKGYYRGNRHVLRFSSRQLSRWLKGPASSQI